MTAAVAMRVVQRAILGAFLTALIAGVFLPVYTDEIGWRFQERAGFDGVDKMFAEQCGPNTLARPPFFMMPVRHFSALLNGAFADPFYVRLSGILYALLWSGLLLALLRRIALEPGRRSELTAIGFGLLALGTLPLLLVWSRPEQPVVLAATAALLLALPGGGAERAWLRALGVAVLALIAMSYHVKGILLAPLFLCCLVLTGSGRNARWAQAVAAVAIVVATAIALDYWVHRLQCPGDPILRAEYARNNMGLRISEGGGIMALVEAVRGLIANATLLDYFGMPAPRERPLSSWLAAGQIAQGASFRWFIALLLAWSLALAFALAAFLHRLGGQVRDRRIDPRALLAAALLGTALLWSALQSIRNVYEASFVLPLVALALVLGLSLAPAEGLMARLLKPLGLVLGLGGLVSLGLVATIYGPSLARAAGQRGYIAEQPYSVPVSGYGDLAGDIAGAAKLCALPPPEQAQAVMVDEVTYFAYMQSRLPQQWLGVLGTWKGSIKDPVAYLKSRGSDGAILGCHHLPPELRARARRQGKFCCLAPPNW